MKRDKLFTYHNELFRSPDEIAGGHLPDRKALRKSLIFKADKGFSELLFKLNISLIVSREYEHLLIALNSDGNKITQTFYPLPHPSGLAIKENRLYTASTRNPNRIIEFVAGNGFLNRVENKTAVTRQNTWRPARTKLYAGAYYLHDLAFINNTLYANSVGHNGIIKVDMAKAESEDVIWQPKLADREIIKLSKGNYLQLNSIAAGESLEKSFFTASVSKPGRLRPGNPAFEVDGRGVVFNGNGEVVAEGLTRPHSAKLHNYKVWLNNSGYGGFGFIENGNFNNITTLPGWTRGLHFRKNIAFVGISRILKKFESYAPGLKNKNTISAIIAIDINSGKEIGRIVFPNGNQIFAIESIKKDICNGFIFNNINTNSNRIKSYFYKYKI